MFGACKKKSQMWRCRGASTKTARQGKRRHAFINYRGGLKGVSMMARANTDGIDFAAGVQFTERTAPCMCHGDRCDPGGFGHPQAGPLATTAVAECQSPCVPGRQASPIMHMQRGSIPKDALVATVSTGLLPTALDSIWQDASIYLFQNWKK